MYELRQRISDGPVVDPKLPFSRGDAVLVVVVVLLQRRRSRGRLGLPMDDADGGAHWVPNAQYRRRNGIMGQPFEQRRQPEFERHTRQNEGYVRFHQPILPWQCRRRRRRGC